MDILVKPSKLCGSISAPSSVDYAHRIFLAAALSDRFTDVYINRMTQNLRATFDALLSVGSMIWRRDFGYEVHPCNRTLKLGFVDARESAETLFFMLPTVLALFGYGEFTCGKTLDKNTAEPLVKILQEHGCKFSDTSLPFVARGKLCGGRYVMPHSADSKLVSSLLLALPILGEESEIVLTDRLPDRNGVTVTLEVLHSFGMQIREYDNRFLVPRGCKYTSPRKISVPADEKSAACWLLADFLGAEVRTDADKGEITSDFNRLKNDGDVNINIKNYANLLPYFAAAASGRHGKCRISGVHNADLTAQTCAALSSLGAKAVPSQDGVTVYGGTLSGGLCGAYENPDLTAALAVLSSFCPEPTHIHAAELPYPRFPDDFQAVGGLFFEKQ